MKVQILTDSSELGNDLYEATTLPGVWVCPGSGVVVILNDDDTGVMVDISGAE
jgi:hypothetical protein